VFPDDTPDELAKRVLQVEHVLYPRVVEAVASGHIRLDANNRVVFETMTGLPHFPIKGSEYLKLRPEGP
jgi:hypothetical protein